MTSSSRRLLILAYHRVLMSPDLLSPGQTEVTTFERHAAALARYFRVLKLSDAARRLAEGTLPARSVAITFDDGYRDNFELALPILKRNELTATFFIATGFLDGGRMWNDTLIESIRHCKADSLDLSSLELGTWPLETVQQCRAALASLIPELKYLSQDERGRLVKEIAAIAGNELPDNLMMRAHHVRALHDEGMEIGAHTVSHPILTRLSEDSAKEEICRSQQYLQELINAPVLTFAYPNGRPGLDYDCSHVEMVRNAGFQFAVSTAWGSVRRSSDLLQLGRIGSWDHNRWKFSLRLLHAYFAAPALTV